MVLIFHKPQLCFITKTQSTNSIWKSKIFFQKLIRMKQTVQHFRSKYESHIVQIIVASIWNVHCTQNPEAVKISFLPYCDVLNLISAKKYVAFWPNAAFNYTRRAESESLYKRIKTLSTMRVWQSWASQNFAWCKNVIFTINYKIDAFIWWNQFNPSFQSSVRWNSVTHPRVFSILCHLLRFWKHFSSRISTRIDSHCSSWKFHLCYNSLFHRNRNKIL